MALYFYQGFDNKEKRVNGSIDAQSEQEVKAHLSSQGIFPTKIILSSSLVSQGFSFKNLFIGGVSVKDKILFTKQLAVLLKSGVPLLQSIELLSSHLEGRLKSILVDVKDNLKGGMSFANCLAKYPKTFDNTYIQLVNAGEASGKLEMILDRLTHYLERREEITKRVKKAFSYPLIQLGITVMVVIALVTLVVPSFEDIFKSQKQDLPMTTKFLMDVSHLLIDHYVLILASILAVILGFYYWAKTPQGGYTIDKIKLHIPIVSFFARMGAVVSFCSSLGMLLEGGVNLAEALSIVCKIINNRILSDTLEEAKENIVKQGKISQYLSKTKIFPPIAIYLINTGEQSGQLDQMLLTVSKNYEVELMELSDSLAAKIEPIMLLLMAGVVGFVVMAVMSPIMRMTEVLG